MADAFFYSFISSGSTALIERISYNRILDLFHYSLSQAPSLFAHKTNTQNWESISSFNRSFRKNYASF